MNIGYLTGTRADYGRMSSLLSMIEKTDDLNLHLIAFGMHLDSTFGDTINDFQGMYENVYICNINKTACDSNIFSVSRLVELQGFLTNFLININLDLLIVFGDRDEMLVSALVAIHFNIPILHIGGGDISGSYDDKFRNAISALSDYHVVSNEKHLQRLIGFGVNRDRIYNYGSQDITSIINVRNIFLKDINVYLDTNLIEKEYCILMYHPVTGKDYNINLEIKIIIDTLIDINIDIICIYPNSDKNYKDIIAIIDKNRENLIVFKNIEYDYFINILKRSKFIIGNSSSGIIESSYLNIPSINIIGRQIGRLKGNNVINVKASRNEILSAVIEIGKNDFLQKLSSSKNIYGFGDSDKLTFNLIRNIMFMK